MDLLSFTESVTPLTWSLKRKFKTINEILNKLERVYYLEYFNEMNRILNQRYVLVSM